MPVPAARLDRRSFVLSFLLTASAHVVAHADPTPGFREEWAGTSVQDWGGGNQYSNPGTGGVLGPGDGFLLISNVSPAVQSKLGSFKAGAEYSGDWRAAGVTQVRVWLNDVNADDALEIHFGIGVPFSNFWQYDVGFIPPENSWAEFVVHLNDGSNWTPLFGPGEFEDAVLGASQILFRHDFAPYTQFPDDIRADIGIDHLLLTDGTVGVETPGFTAARPLELAPPFPNPARGSVNFAFESFDTDPVTLQIVDVAGRVIRQAVVAGSFGRRAWVWDGLDGGGRPMPAGSYRVRAFGVAGGVSRPVILVR